MFWYVIPLSTAAGKEEIQMCDNANVHAPDLKLKAEKLVVFYWDVLELHVLCEGLGMALLHVLIPILSTISSRLVKVNAASLL